MGGDFLGKKSSSLTWKPKVGLSWGISPVTSYSILYWGVSCGIHLINNFTRLRDYDFLVCRETVMYKARILVALARWFPESYACWQQFCPM